MKDSRTVLSKRSSNTKPHKLTNIERSNDKGTNHGVYGMLNDDSGMV